MKVRYITFILLIITITAYGQSLNKLSILGKWKLLDPDRTLLYHFNTCYCDTSFSWTFNKDGTFRYEYEYGRKVIVSGDYFLDGNYLSLKYGGNNDRVKVYIYKNAYLIMAVPYKQQVFKKNQYVGEIKDYPLPIYRGNYFLEGNSLEADINSVHVVFDSVYAFKYTTQIIVHAFNKERQMAIALRFGIYANDNIYSSGVSLIGSGNLNGIGANSDATFKLGKKDFNTTGNIFLFPNDFGYGKGTGTFKNIKYKAHRFTFDELSSEFEFKASYKDLSSLESLPAEEISITNGKFTINRIIDYFTKNDVLLNKDEVDRIRKKDFDADFNAGKVGNDQNRK